MTSRNIKIIQFQELKNYISSKIGISDPILIREIAAEVYQDTKKLNSDKSFSEICILSKTIFDKRTKYYSKKFLNYKNKDEIINELSNVVELLKKTLMKERERIQELEKINYTIHQKYQTLLSKK